MQTTKRGPKPEYKTAKVLESKINEYFEECEAEDKFPSRPGMLLYLQLSEKEVDDLKADGHKNSEDNKAIFERAKMLRNAWLCEHIANAENAKSINGYKLLLMQEENGGYIDRPGDKGKVDLNIKIDGVGGWSAFE